MKNDRKAAASPAETNMSVIGAGMTFVGDCETKGGIRIDGTLEGSVRAGESVVVSAGGVVTGDIDSREAVVAGTVKGKVKCASRVEFRQTGRVDGEVHTPRMHMVDGAMVNGPVHVTGTRSSPKAEESSEGGRRAKSR